MPPRMQTSMDSDSLQADVMRFMAIIAFCLIAILALVRNVEAPVVTPVPEPVSKRPAPVHTAVPVPAPIKPVAPVAMVDKPEPLPITALQPIAPALPPKAPDNLEISQLNRPLQPATVVPTRRPVEPLTETTAVAPVESIAAALPPAPEPALELDPGRTKQEAGLSLRFESDRDFLRLVSKRDIQVYLFNDQDAQRLTNSYQFAAAKPPTQLYEVLAETIPDAISGAAQRDLGTVDSYRWGIAMPAPIEAQISGYIAAAAAGELVIDRYGKVHHVE